MGIALACHLRWVVASNRNAEALCQRAPRTDRPPPWVAEPYAFFPGDLPRPTGVRLLPGPVRTDSTFSRRLAVVGKRGATVLPVSGSTTSLRRWGHRVLPDPGSWCRQTHFWRTRPMFCLLLSLVVNLELMDVTKKAKIKDVERSWRVIEFQNGMNYSDGHRHIGGDSSHLPRPSRRLCLSCFKTWASDTPVEALCLPSASYRSPCFALPFAWFPWG